MSTLESKRELLVGKMVSGATALNDFFDAHYKDRDCPTLELAAKLSNQYFLTENQRRYLVAVAKRTEQAREMVKVIEHKFGIDDTGMFQDARGAYQYILRENPPKEVKVRSDNIGIEVIRKRWNYDEKQGFVRRDKRSYEGMSLSNLVSHIPSIEACQNGVDSRKWTEGMLLPKVFSDGKNKDFLGIWLHDRISDHERRHVIDNIIGLPSSHSYIEGQAYFYAGLSYVGIALDFARVRDNIQFRIGRCQNRLKDSSGYPPILVEKDKELLQEDLTRLANLEPDMRKVITSLGKMAIMFNLQAGGHGRNLPNFGKSLSFIFSTVKDSKVPHRMELILNNLI